MHLARGLAALLEVAGAAAEEVHMAFDDRGNVVSEFASTRPLKQPRNLEAASE